MKTMFARTDKELPGWFWAGSAAGLGSGQVRGLDLLGRPVVVWRDLDGRCLAMDRRCAHMGADLSQGKVTAQGLTCPFHHWSYDGRGRCSQAPPLNGPPGRQLNRYPQLWVFLGPEPLFALPDCPEPPVRVLHVGPVAMKCHPHMCLANGVDGEHFRALHGMDFPVEPTYEFPDEYRVIHHFQGIPRSPWLRRWVGQPGTPLLARFTTYGANLGWLDVAQGGSRFAVLFNGWLRPQGHTGNHMLFFLFRPWGPNLTFMIRLLPLLFYDDQRILEAVDFTPGFVEGADDGMIGLARVVDRLVAISG